MSASLLTVRKCGLSSFKIQDKYFKQRIRHAAPLHGGTITLSVASLGSPLSDNPLHTCKAPAKCVTILEQSEQPV